MSGRGRVGTRRRWRLAGFGFAGLAACALPLRGPPPADPLSSHAIESARLAEEMRGLEFLARERLPQAMDLEQERTRRLYKVARVAGAIAESAGQLEGAVAEVPLSGSSRRAFADQAELLRRRARRLAREAHRLSPEEIRAQATGLEETCDACHRRFRDPSGRVE